MTGGAEPRSGDEVVPPPTNGDGSIVHDVHVSSSGSEFDRVPVVTQVKRAGVRVHQARVDWSPSDASYGGIGAAIAGPLESELSDPDARIVVRIHADDPHAASVPWELATIGPEALTRSAAVASMVRCGSAGPPTIGARVTTPGVCLAVLEERRDRGNSEYLVAAIRRAGGRVDFIRGYGEALGRELMERRENRIVHLVASMTPSRGDASLMMLDGEVPPERLASWLADGSERLFVLDIAMYGSDHDAAEQLRLANSFCWSLTHAEPAISVVCGVFAGANYGVPATEALVGALSGGKTLRELAGALQHLSRTPPFDLHPVRTVVSVHTADAEQRFALESPPP